jgi:hypothetical protein
MEALIYFTTRIIILACTATIIYINGTDNKHGDTGRISSENMP